ncbi:hypothetical protein LCGC14_2647090, partial [marine sediment metagenome]
MSSKNPIQVQILLPLGWCFYRTNTYYTEAS